MSVVTARIVRGIGSVALALGLLAFAFGSSATAAPVHVQAADPIAGFALNHACGTAVDSAGDLYVSSAGDGKVEVFGSSGAHLTSIANANEPCGLAVDTHGTLFVTQKANGKVVRYVPSEQPPFAATPIYDPAEEIDASGEAAGIAVDTTVIVTNSKRPTGGEDSLFVAKGDHVDAHRNEKQDLSLNCPGGTYTLEFKGQKTAPLACEASHEDVQKALETLATIGKGNVSVTTANFGATDHGITFIGNLGLANQPKLIIDTTNLTGSASQSEKDGGLVGPLAEDAGAKYTGVAAYTYQIVGSLSGEKFTRYLYAADAEGDEVKVFSGESLTTLKTRRTIEGPKAGEDFGFGGAGAYLAVDGGNGNMETKKCVSVDKQACTAGHLLVYDDAHEVVDEFDATGEFLDRIESSEFKDAEPTGLAVERSGGPDDGTIYITAGAGAGAKVLAFGPLVRPSRKELKPPDSELSKVLKGAQAVATDPHGDIYVASGPSISVFDPDGAPLTTILDARVPYDLAVDSKCNVYVLDGASGDEQATYYAPPACPPGPGATFIRHGPAVVPSSQGLKGIAVNPADDHAFVFGAAFAAPLAEFEPPPGSAKVRECGAGFVSATSGIDLAIDGDEGGEEDTRVYVSVNPFRLVGIDCGPAVGAEEIIAETIGDGGCEGGAFGTDSAIAVDQSSGHVLQFTPNQGAAREYDAALSCVAEFGQFNENVGRYAIAVDNGTSSPNKGNVYVAFDGFNEAVQPFDLTAFEPLSYGEIPKALTGVADEIGGGNATLRGTVDPKGFPLESCEFEYLLDSKYIENGKNFSGATAVPCAETPAQISAGSGAVPVHADLTGLQANERYRFRLLAKNEFGTDVGEPGLFGLPEITGEKALPVRYDEATLRAAVDPSGLATEYHFEYATVEFFEAHEETYEHSTAAQTLPPGDGPVAVEAQLSGLIEGTPYRFRLLASNEAGESEGADRDFETQQRLQGRLCPNTEYRTGLSAKLPDCRAYELVTPPDTRGQELNAVSAGSSATIFNNWLVTPRGAGAGESVAYFAGTLPGFEGSGDTDGYRATRAPGEHPTEGWGTEFYGPSYAQLGGGAGNNQEGVSADQRYWLWVSGAEIFPALLPLGHYLRVPKGLANEQCNVNGEDFQDEFELVGCGSEGTDPQAESRFVSAGGEHVVFFSKAHLEEKAAPEGTMAIYDRKAGEASAEVISVKPDKTSFGVGENATYVGASEDGSTVLFRAGGTLYAHRGGQSVELPGAASFAGASENGARVFYGDGFGEEPASLFTCDLDLGPCDGAGSVEIAPESIFVGVSPDGSHAFFTAEENLTPGQENENGEEALANEPNLYAWDGATTRFVAILDPDDFESFAGRDEIDLLHWIRGVNAGQNIGRANAPTRFTPGGGVFVFQSHARLTAYDNAGKGEIYRFEPAATAGEQLICISCDPTGAPASADAMLQLYAGDSGGHTHQTTMIPNVTDDGEAVFFHSPERLVPEDANDVVDVYEWKARGAGEGSEECKRAVGCLALISSGQGEQMTTIYSMSADGHDVFIETPEVLVRADIFGSESIYDARVEGGIPDPPSPPVCHGDACQPAGAALPSPPVPGSAASVPDGNLVASAGKCGKGKRKVKRKGKVRCVKKPAKHKSSGGHKSAGRGGRR